MLQSMGSQRVRHDSATEQRQPLRSSQEFSRLQSLRPSNTSSEECHTNSMMTILSSFIQRQPNGQLCGVRHNQQERDTGDCSCALKWTQRLSRLWEAQLPHQHQGWPLLEAQGTPRRCTAAPPLSGYHSLSLAYYRSWLHTWSLHLKGRPSLPGRGRPRHLDHLPPPRGPLYLLVSSMGYGWGTKPSQ